MSTHQAVRELQSFLDGYAFPEMMTILEAGSGSLSHLAFQRDSCIVGIDISEKQLNLNRVLDFKIRGDIQNRTCVLSAFDVIICWDVLEHLEKPDWALENFSELIKGDGLIILGLPNVSSIKGLITKYTPFFVHGFFYRKIFRKSISDSQGNGPFPTFLKSSISPKSIKKFADSRQLKMEFFRYYDPMAKYLKQRNRRIYFVYQFLYLTFKVLSLGKLGSSDFIIVLRRN